MYMIKKFIFCDPVPLTTLQEFVSFQQYTVGSFQKELLKVVCTCCAPEEWPTWPVWPTWLGK